MLSELRRHRLVDAEHRGARLVDLAVDLSMGDYPAVTRVIFREARGRQMELPVVGCEVAPPTWRQQAPRLFS